MAWDCPSCGSTATGRYCADCGERAPRASGAAAGLRRRRVRDAVQAPWVKRMRASIAALASPPGRLTRDWNSGRRVDYLSPISLFLYVNVAFFLIQSASHVSILSWPYAVHVDNDVLGVGRRAAEWIVGPNFARDPARVAVFDAMERVYAKALVVIMLPLFAAAMMLAPTPRRGGYAAAFTFAAHYYTFALFALSALFPWVALLLHVFGALGFKASADTIDWSVTSLQALAIGWYIVRALGTTTTLPRWRRILLALGLVAVTGLVLRLYHLVVFVVTLLGM